MNSVFKFIVGFERYEVNCPVSSKMCGILMSEFAEKVFGVKVVGGEAFEFSCLCANSKKICAFLSAYNCPFRMISDGGIMKHIRTFIKKPGMVLGVIFFLISVFYGNCVVWDIDIIGNKRVGDEEIEYILSTLGFEKGKRYNSDMLDTLCNRFVLADNRFTRISVNMSGNKAFVDITERVKSSKSEQISFEGITSKYDCIIERPEVMSGTATVKAGDVIEKGTVVISPVEIGNVGAEYISGAKGKIYGRTTETIAVWVPLDRVAVKSEKEFSNEYTLSFLGHKIGISNPFSIPEEDYLCKVSVSIPRIGEDNKLPFRVKKVCKNRYSTENIRISDETATEVAYKKLYEKIARDFGDCEILSSEFRSVGQDGKVILYCTLECIRDVTV